MTRAKLPSPCLLLSALLLCVFSTFASAQDAEAGEVVADPPVRVELADGTVLVGQFLEATEDSIVILHPLLGILVIPRDSLVDPEVEPVDLRIPMPEEEEVEVVSPWTKQVSIGVKGEKGNSESRDVNARADVRYETDKNIFTGNIVYTYENSDRETTTDKRRIEGRYEWLYPDSPWRWFIESGAYKDRFKDWDYKWGAVTGPAYEFVKTETVEFVGRAGLGFQDQVGGEEDGTDVVGMLGATYNHKYNDRLAFSSLLRWTPIMNQMDDYTLDTRAQLDIKLFDKKDPWLLSLGAEWEFESEPGDAKASDVDYFANLGFTF